MTTSLSCGVVNVFNESSENGEISSFSINVGVVRGIKCTMVDFGEWKGSER